VSYVYCPYCGETAKKDAGESYRCPTCGAREHNRVGGGATKAQVDVMKANARVRWLQAQCVVLKEQREAARERLRAMQEQWVAAQERLWAALAKLRSAKVVVKEEGARVKKLKGGGRCR